jgi:molecular chaperone DnaK
MQAAPAQEPPKRPATQPRPDPPSDAGSFASRISFDVSPSMSDVVAPRRDLARTAAPILVDVTPCALVVETVGGYCDTVIPRNATIPCEHTRVFATGRDLQNLVHVRVAQGEEEKFDANQYLGEVEVTNLRPAPRGEVLLSVTFEIDANGSLVVRAIDASTGRKAEASMKLITVTQSESEIEEMIERSLSVSVKARV